MLPFKNENSINWSSVLLVALLFSSVKFTRSRKNNEDELLSQPTFDPLANQCSLMDWAIIQWRFPMTLQEEITPQMLPQAQQLFVAKKPTFRAQDIENYIKGKISPELKKQLIQIILRASDNEVTAFDLQYALQHNLLKISVKPHHQAPDNNTHGAFDINTGMIILYQLNNQILVGSQVFNEELHHCVNSHRNLIKKGLTFDEVNELNAVEKLLINFSFQLSSEKEAKQFGECLSAGQRRLDQLEQSLSQQKNLTPKQEKMVEVLSRLALDPVFKIPNLARLNLQQRAVEVIASIKYQDEFLLKVYQEEHCDQTLVVLDEWIRMIESVLNKHAIGSDRQFMLETILMERMKFNGHPAYYQHIVSATVAQFDNLLNTSRYKRQYPALMEELATLKSFGKQLQDVSKKPLEYTYMEREAVLTRFPKVFELIYPELLAWHKKFLGNDVPEAGIENGVVYSKSF